MQPTSFNHDDVEIVEQTSLYQGFFKLNRYTLRHKLFEGGWSGVMQREMLERGHAVAMLPYDPHREEFVLVQQFRAGALETCSNPWLVEIVAGIIEANEQEETVCVREAKEEAGIDVKRLHKALSYLSSPGGTTERIHVFVGEVDASAASGVHGLNEEHEDIKVIRVSEKTAMSWLEKGIIDNAASVIALQWFALNKHRVLQEWGLTTSA